MFAWLLSLVGVTLSGASLTLESTDLSTFGTSITGLGTTLLNSFIALIPYIFILIAVYAVMGMIQKFILKKGRKWGKRR